MLDRTKMVKTGASARRRRSKRLTLPALRYYGSEFVLNAETGLFYHVTPTAVVLLKALAAGAEGDALVQAIQEHAAVDRHTAIRDIELLINDLSIRGIISQSTK